jgi:hypothetical protein
MASARNYGAGGGADAQLGGSAQVELISSLEEYPYKDGVGDDKKPLTPLADAVLKFTWCFTVRGVCQCPETSSGRTCSCVIQVGQGTDVEYIVVSGDPQLIVRALVDVVEQQRTLADSDDDGDDDGDEDIPEPIPETEKLLEMGQVKLLALAKRTGAKKADIDRALTAADGKHPFSLWAMFRRFTHYEITENGFWRITQKNVKILGRNAKPKHSLVHHYTDGKGKTQPEVNGRHLIKCRILRATEAEDRHVIDARLALVHTEVRATSVPVECTTAEQWLTLRLSGQAVVDDDHKRA